MIRGGAVSALIVEGPFWSHREWAGGVLGGKMGAERKLGQGGRVRPELGLWGWRG